MSTTATNHRIPTGSWSADPVHSSVAFELAYAGVGTFRGSFRDFSATIAGGRLEGSAAVASVDVRDEQLDAHLQTPDFFDAERYPRITFRAGDLDRGELEIRGVTRPVELAATVSEPNVDAFGRERIGLTLEATIDRTAYGVSWNAPNQGGGAYLGDDVTLRAELLLVRQEG